MIMLDMHILLSTVTHMCVRYEETLLLRQSGNNFIAFNWRCTDLPTYLGILYVFAGINVIKESK